MPAKFELSYLPQGPGEQLTIREDDVKLVLEKLPADSWSRFQVVHYHDAERGIRWIGYVNREKRQIAISPLPSGVRRIRFVVGGGTKAPQSKLPKRRARIQNDMLFDVFVDDVGRLQIIDEKKLRVRAHPFDAPAIPYTDYWRLKLWTFNVDEAYLNSTGAGAEEIAEAIDVTEET